MSVPSFVSCGELVGYPREDSGVCTRPQGHRGVHRNTAADWGTDTLFRVQECSVDGSYIHEESYTTEYAARDAADRLALKAQGSPWLVSVRVYRERTGIEVYRIGVSR